MFKQKSNKGFEFDSTYTFDQRKAEADRILSKYPERIPIIVEPLENCKIQLDKKKYLVPIDLTVGQFLFVVRKRLNLPPEKALFFFVNGTIPSSTIGLNEVYKNHVKSDGFLKLKFSEENVFG